MIDSEARLEGDARDADDPCAAGALGAPVRPDRERRRAAAYLDLWERNVSRAAVRGQGVPAPGFAR